MSKSSTSNRLKQLMHDRNLKQIDILNKAQPYCIKYGVKLGKSDLSQYISGRNNPSQKKLTILGLALNVNEAWLMGFDVPMERSDKKQNNTNDEKMIIEKYYKLNKEQQENLLNYAEFLLQQQKDK